MSKIRTVRGSILLAGVGVALMCWAPLPSARACNEIVTWYAEMAGSNEAPAVTSTGTGKATVVFDFEHPVATIKLDTQNLQDVQKVELRACLKYGELSGPTLLTIYDAKDGPLPIAYSKTFTDADVVKQTTPNVSTVKDVVGVVINGQAVVVVMTKAHPEGEIAGKITMHKTSVFSDAPGAKFHDPKLHQAHTGDTPAPTH